MSRRKHPVQYCDGHAQYQAGCEACKERARDYEKRRSELVRDGYRLSAPAEHVVGRLRELRAAGYTLAQLEAETGLPFRHLSRLALGHHPAFVQLNTFQAVERAYQRLRDVPGGSRSAALRSQRYGWTPPEVDVPILADEDAVDDVAVMRACRGERVPLTRAELNAAWEKLEARGLTAGRIGELLHVAERTVQRWRDEGAPRHERQKAAGRGA